MSNVLRLAACELLGIEPRPSPADELYLRLSADPAPVLGELRLVADQLGDARAVLAEARRYQIEPGLEDATCHLCGVTDRPLCYNVPKTGSTLLVCDDDEQCAARAERAWLVLSAADEARAVVARAAAARDALRRWQADQMEHRGQEMEQPVMPDAWSGTLRHPGNRVDG